MEILFFKFNYIYFPNSWARGYLLNFSHRYITTLDDDRYEFDKFYLMKKKGIAYWLYQPKFIYNFTKFEISLEKT